MPQSNLRTPTAIRRAGDKIGGIPPILDLYSCGDKTFAELTNFPVHKSMVTPNYWEEVEKEKQRRLTGESDAPAKEPAQAPETILDAPPTVVNPALTGRIRPEWKGNGK